MNAFDGDKQFSGACIGGPLDGKVMAQRVPTVRIPIFGVPGVSHGQYEFHFGAWMWRVPLTDARGVKP